MKFTQIALASSMALGSLCAQAQTVAATPETEFYGLLDVTARYSTNQSATGQSKAELVDGVLTGSRLGVRGKHPVGGLKVVYTAEAGFAPDTGVSQQGGRLLGRQLFVGLESAEAGTVLAGRQYTVAHDVMSRYEAFAYANNSIAGYQGGNYTGLRYDNTVKYLKSFGPVQIQFGHTFDEKTTNPTATAAAGTNKSAEALAAVYTDGPLSAGLVYQQTKGISNTAYFGLAAAEGSTQKVLGGGATYQAGPAKLFLGYTDSKVVAANYKNSVISVGANFQATDALQLIGTVQSDTLKGTAKGKRLTTAFMADYFLDKVTDVYVEVDYTQVKDGWVGLANDTDLGSGNMFGRKDRTGVMVGLRLKF